MALNPRDDLGSPVFPKTNSNTIAAGASTVLRWDTNASQEQKYVPFNFVVITNNSTENIYFAPNESSAQRYLIPGGVVRSFDKKSIPAFTSCLITNAGSSTIAVDAIVVEAQREVLDSETIIQRGVRRLIGKGAI